MKRPTSWESYGVSFREYMIDQPLWPVWQRMAEKRGHEALALVCAEMKRSFPTMLSDLAHDSALPVDASRRKLVDSIPYWMLKLCPRAQAALEAAFQLGIAFKRPVHLCNDRGEESVKYRFRVAANKMMEATNV